MKPLKVFSLDDDFALIKKFNEGDELAFKELLQRHKEKVRNLIYLVIGKVDAIDDIAQNVFLSVYKNLHKFRFESQFATWLHRITVNKCRDFQRKEKFRHIFSTFSLSTDEDNEIEIPTEFSDDFDTSEIVRSAVNKLPEKLRIPLVLRDFEGYSYQEIADIIKTEVGTVKSRIFRARESLRKILEPIKEELL